MPAACCWRVAVAAAAARLLALLLRVASDSLQSAAAAHPALVVDPRLSWLSHIQAIIRLLVAAAASCSLRCLRVRPAAAPSAAVSAAVVVAVACGLVLHLPADYCCYIQPACCSLCCCRRLRPGAVLHAVCSCFACSCRCSCCFAASGCFCMPPAAACSSLLLLSAP